MYITRKIEYDILQLLKRQEILAIVGPRQCGKTTMLKKIYNSLEKAIFLSFEDHELLTLFERDINRFIDMYIRGFHYVFIDEFQYARNGGKLLKYIYDTYHTKIIISGSSAIDLTVKAVKFLVGRILVLSMHPFDFSEYLQAKSLKYAGWYKKMKIHFTSPIIKTISTSEELRKICTLYEEYVLWGGYPQVVLSASKTEKELVLKNIVNTYFLRDVKNTLELVDDYKLEKLLKGIAFQVSNMVQFTELSELSECSLPTVKRYMNFLDKTYICGLAQPFYTNKRTEIVKNKKAFFYDTGLRNSVVNDFRLLHERPDGGALLENAVWCQLIRQGFKPQYWRDKNKNEIDFVVDFGDGISAAIEIKMQEKKCQNPPSAFMRAHAQMLYYCGYLYDDSPSLSQYKNSFFLPRI